MKHGNFRSATALLAALVLMTGCGGGDGGSGGEQTEAQSAEDKAEARFRAVADSSTQLVVPSMVSCLEGSACDVSLPAGDVIGKDMVMAINDPQTMASGAALLRMPAVDGHAQIPDVPAPAIPPAEGGGVVG